MNPDKPEMPELQMIERIQKLRLIPPRELDMIQLGKEQFLNEAKKLSSLPVTETSKNRLNKWYEKFKKQLFNIRKERLSMSALATIILIISLLGGGAGTVYAAQSSMPDDALYPLKTLSEDVRLQITDSENQLNLLEEFTERRIMEISSTLEDNQIVSDTVTERLQIHLKQSIMLAANEDEQLESTLLQLQERLRDQSQIMDRLQIQNTEAVKQMEQVREMLQNQLHIVEEGVVDPMTFRLRYQNPNENVPDNIPGVIDNSDVGETSSPEEESNGKPNPEINTESTADSVTQATTDKAGMSSDATNDTNTQSAGKGNGQDNNNRQENTSGEQLAPTSETISDKTVATTSPVPTTISPSLQSGGNGNNQAAGGNDNDGGSGEDNSNSGGNGGGGGSGNGKGK